MDAILCSIEDPHVSGLDDSDDTFSGLERLGVKQIRSNHHGRVVKIECVYNGSIEDMSDSLKGFVTKLDKERQQLNKVTHTFPLPLHFEHALQYPSESHVFKSSPEPAHLLHTFSPG